jgi:predicted ATPase/DNA-binding SARP family transcriptional activator
MPTHGEARTALPPRGLLGADAAGEARCRIEVLGDLRVRHGDRTLAQFRTQKAAALLTYLALHGDRSHAREQLIERFWPDLDPEAARDNLSTTLSSLRRLLEPAGVPAGSILVADRHSLRLHPENVITDVSEFEALLRAASRARDAAERAALLERAIPLYRGELLPGCYDDWALQEQMRLREQYADALEQWAAVLEEGGDLEGALRAAQQAVQADPYREAAHQTQMRLYAALGRAGTALESYAKLRQFLADEIGVSPAAATRELAEQIRRDPGAFAVERHAATAPAEGGRPASEARAAESASLTAPASPVLPEQWTRFFGRENEMARLRELLAGSGTSIDGPPGERSPSAPLSSHHRPRLITLTGPGGAGKTRLAIEVARQAAPAFARRVWFVELASLPVPDLIPFAMAEVLALTPAPGIDPLEQVVRALRDEPCLLVLDNFEHLLRELQAQTKSDRPLGAGGAALVRLLLERVPQLICLITSRQPLHLAGEQEFPVPPLAVPPVPDSPSPTPEHPNTRTPEHLLQCASVALYTDRARAVNPEFAVTPGNAVAVAALCAKLEGMPLAIEMAAAWARLLPPARILERLEQQLEILVSRRRDVPPRHQSLRATLDWSYALLAPELRTLLARLSVFRGGWTLEAAEAIAVCRPVFNRDRQDELADPVHPVYPCSLDLLANPRSAIRNPAVLDQILQLQEQSLILVGEWEGEPRYRMLEPVREYAGEKLRECGEEASTRSAHAAYFLTLAETGEPRMCGRGQLQWLDVLEAEQGNLRAALAWCLESPGDGEAGLRLASAVTPFWVARHRRDEDRRYLDALLASPQAAGRTAARAAALYAAALLDHLKGDVAAARAPAAESLAISEELGDRPGIARTLLLGPLSSSWEEARRLATRSLALAREGQNAMGIILALTRLSEIASAAREYDAARDFHREALAIARFFGDRMLEAGCLAGLGRTEYDRRDYPAARDCLQGSLALLREFGCHGMLGIPLYLLGWLAFQESDYPAARALWEECREVDRRNQNKGGWVLGGLAELAAVQGDSAAARALWEESLAEGLELGRLDLVARALRGLGDVARLEGDFAGALTHYAESLQAIPAAAGLQEIRIADERPQAQCAACLRGIAAILSRSGREGPATRLLGAAEALTEAVGAVLPAAAQAAYQDQIVALRQALGEAGEARFGRRVPARSGGVDSAGGRAPGFAAAWAEGRALPPEEAIACALEAASNADRGFSLIVEE